MSETVGRTAPELLLCMSNLNLPPHEIAVAGVERHKEILDEIHNGSELFNGGFDVTPTRRLAIDARLGKFEPQEGERPFASLVHQTWPKGLLAATIGSRRERTLAGWKLNSKGYLAMPTAQGSLAVASFMSEQLGNVPMCVYPEYSDNFQHYGPHVATQIGPENIAAAGGPDKYREFHDILYGKGIRGVIIDGHHIQRGDLPAVELLGAVAATGTNVTGLHAAVARTDGKIKSDRDRSLKEFAALLKGPKAFGRESIGRIMGIAYTIAVEQRAESNFIPQSRFKEANRSARAAVAAQEETTGTKIDFWDLSLIYASDPLTAQARAENIYRTGAFKETQAAHVPVTLEVPFDGIVAYQKERDRVATRADFASMTRDAAQHLTEFFKNPGKYTDLSPTSIKQ